MIWDGEGEGGWGVGSLRPKTWRNPKRVRGGVTGPMGAAAPADPRVVALPRPQVGLLFRDSVIIVLSTPCTMGTIVALILNAIIPTEAPDPEEGVIRADHLVPLDEKERLEAEAVLAAEVAAAAALAAAAKGPGH